MSIEDPPLEIGSEEFAAEYRRLIGARVPFQAPEFQALFERVARRDATLFERYGKPYLATHPGKWIAIALDGRVLIRDTAGEATWAAVEEFGRGRYCTRKLAEFPGHQIHF